MPVRFVPDAVRELFRCRVLRPLLRLLRGGITPRRLAWSLALGLVVGINPSVGLTTVVVVMLAWVFGLNQVASQIGTRDRPATPVVACSVHRSRCVFVSYAAAAAQP